MGIGQAGSIYAGGWEQACFLEQVIDEIGICFFQSVGGAGAIPTWTGEVIP